MNGKSAFRLTKLLLMLVIFMSFIFSLPLNVLADNNAVQHIGNSVQMNTNPEQDSRESNFRPVKNRSNNRENNSNRNNKDNNNRDNNKKDDKKNDGKNEPKVISREVIPTIVQENFALQPSAQTVINENYQNQSQEQTVNIGAPVREVASVTEEHIVYPVQYVKSTPETGAEDLALLSLPTMGGIGFFLRRKLGF